MEIKIIVNPLFDLFFPTRCLDCQDVVQSSQFLCVSCTTKLPFSHWNFDQHNIVYHKLKNLCDIEKAYSLFIFKHNNSAQKLLHEMKYKNRPEIGEDLARLIKLDLSHFDGIIPIPLHEKRMKKRGYNQVDSFARTLAEINGISYFPKALIRTKYQSSQVKEDKLSRIENLRDTFKVNQDLPYGHYIVIDDVITTGATISSAIKQFNFSENFKISVLSIACA